MNKKDVTKFISVAKATLSKKSPEILTGLGIAGMVTTTVLAVKATPKALELIEDEKRQQRWRGNRIFQQQLQDQFLLHA